MEGLYRSFEAKRHDRRQAESAEQTRSRLKQRLTDALAIPLPVDELRPRLLERVVLADHIRERVEFGTFGGLRVPAYVLLPKGPLRGNPAVLAVHGHGYGSRQISGLLPDGTVNVGKPDVHGNYALELVRRGLVVLVPEVFGFGDRRLAADLEAGEVGSNSCQALAAHLLLYGIPLAGLRVQEALRALDYLATREEVDPQRIGCFGFSGGGLVGAYASALDARIRATVLCAFANTFQGSIMHVRHCIDNYVPGALDIAELPELIGLIAPRALFIELGEQDPIFPAITARAAVEHLQRTYAHEQAEARLGVHLFPGVHEVNGRQAYPWLVEQLYNY